MCIYALTGTTLVAATATTSTSTAWKQKCTPAAATVAQVTNALWGCSALLATRTLPPAPISGTARANPVGLERAATIQAPMAALRTISTPTPLGYGRSRLFNFVRLFETYLLMLWYVHLVQYQLISRCSNKSKADAPSQHCYYG